MKDVIEAVLRRMGSVLQPFEVRTLIRPDLPLVAIDPIQMDQALTNILENAARFSPPGSEIRIVVPSPFTLSARITPPCALMMACAMERPMPMPSPSARVVKM